VAETTDPSPGLVVLKVGATLGAGTRISHYEVVDLLGKGGMGEVYRARDLDLERTVAIKIVRTDHLHTSSEALRREAQTMARLSHPNVVVVYEVGSFGDEIYLAMEYVEGQTVRRWRNAAKRSWREVLRVFVAAANGLAAAHRAGIVHRDFKPDNLLIDDDGRVRVADFGLAGAAPEVPVASSSAELGNLDTVRFSAVESGTPAYMSPEQHLHDTLDARSDQFAYSVALFEALYGRCPFGGDTYAEIRRRVLARELEPPPRDTEVPAWVRAVVLRGLEHDPARRFPSMTALVESLERDPAQRRRRVLVAGALAVVAAVAAYGLGRSGAPPSCAGAAARLAGVWDDRVRQRMHDSFARAGAEGRFERAARGLDAYAASWSAMHREACEATSVRHEQSEALLDLRMQCLERRRAELRALVELLSDKVDDDLAQQAPRLPQKLGAVTACADAEALRKRWPPPATAAERERVAALRGRLAKVAVLRIAARMKPARPIAEAALAEARVLAYPPALAEALHLAGATSLKERALQLDADAIEAAARVGDDSLEAEATGLLMQTLDAEGRVADALALAPAARAAAARAASAPAAQGYVAMSLAAAHVAAAAYDEALVEATRAVALYQTAQGPDSYDMAQARSMLGVVLWKLGRTDEGLEETRRVRATMERLFGPDNNNVASACVNLSALLGEVGRYQEALDEGLRAVATFDKSGNRRGLARALNNTADQYLALGRLDDGLAMHQRALALNLEIDGRGNPHTARSRFNVGVALARLGRLDEALEQQRQALAAREAALGPGHEDVAESLAEIGDELRVLGRLGEARAALERGVAVAGKLGADLPITGAVLTALGRLELAEGRSQDALATAGRAAAIHERGHSHRLADALALRGEALLALSRPAEAVPVLERAVPLHDDRDPAGIELLLARALWDADGDRGRALALARRAADEAPRGQATERRARAWIAGHAIGR
jgi:tetratricopeptide (TPR) repeat protein/tRNA A-37 threonylcarbamoyl transferase component Bud32